MREGGRPRRGRKADGRAMLIVLGKRQQQASKRTATAGMSSSLWLCGGMDVGVGQVVGGRSAGKEEGIWGVGVGRFPH